MINKNFNLNISHMDIFKKNTKNLKQFYPFISIHEIDGNIRDSNSEQKYLFHSLITPWSLAHFMIGYFMAYFGFSFKASLLLHIMYEITTFNSKIATAQWNDTYDQFFGDSHMNSLGDEITFALGFYICQKYSSTKYLTELFSIINFIFHLPFTQNWLIRRRREALLDKYKIKINLSKLEKIAVGNNSIINLIKYAFTDIYFYSALVILMVSLFIR